MAGPTVAGSIVAKLRVDDSAWSAEMAAAGAKADELGRHDPKIRIDVDSAAAIAKMAAVESAEKRVDVANQALRLSYLRLDEAQGKGGVSAARLAALHLAASRAESAHESATKRLAAAQLELAAANETEEVSESRANDTHGMTVSRMGLIIAAIAVLVPMLAPLAGYAVGVAGALAGMGAAGVLAVIGIKQAMEQGTTAGHLYSDGLQTLKGDMNGLAATSASAMLSSFQQAVQMINADMPNLNGQIATFSQMLGEVGTTVLAGVLNSFKILNPLFVQAGEYVQDLADGFKQWTEDGGLQKFATYAQQSLPQVAQTLGSLASAILHIVEATAPIGSATLGILTAFGNAINAIPTPALTAVVAAAAAVFIAVKAWNGLTPIVGNLSKSMTGLKGSALGAAGAIAGIAIVADSAALAGMSSAMKGINDAFGQTRSVNEYSKAVANGNINMKKLGEHLQVAGGFFNDFSKNMQNATGGYNVAYGELGKLDQALAAATPKDLIAGYKQLQAEGKKTGKSTEDMANLFPLATAAFNSVKNGADGASGKIGSIGTSAETAGAAIDALAQKVAGFGNTALKESQSQIAFQQSVDDASASIAQNGATLDLSTAAGRANMTALDGIASSTTSLVAAQIANHDSTETVTASMESGRAAFIAAAEAAGMTASQANTLADSLGLVPRNVDVAIGASGVGPTLAEIQSVKDSIAGIERHIDVSIQLHGAENLATQGGLKVANENGNMYSHGAVQAFADGGFPSGLYAGRPGGIHKFAEQQTGWEAYISGKPGQEARNTGIALKALSKLGYQQPQQQRAQAPSLTGLEISGVLDMGNGLTGMLRGVIQQELTQQGMALSNGVRPLA